MYPFEFVLFALTLLGVALLHHRTLEVALAGLASVVLYKLVFSGFHGMPGRRPASRHTCARSGSCWRTCSAC